jgi:hypothetical protein
VARQLSPQVTLLEVLRGRVHRLTPPFIGARDFERHTIGVQRAAPNKGPQTMKKLLIAALLILTFPAVPSARAELVGEFDAGVRNVRAWGAYTVVASARVYDTTGAPAARLASATVHFPRGASLRKRFLSGPYFCDGARLEANPDPALCRNAQFASGSVLLDARPGIEEPVAASIWLFLAPAGARGATAGIVILVRANQRSPAWNYDVLHGYLIPEARSASGFGYRLELPVTLQPLLPQVTLSLIEMKLRIPGIEQRQLVRVCVRRAHGHCTARRRKTRRTFWLKVPACPRGRKVAFGADYAFLGGKTITKRRKVSCSRFLDLPSTHNKGPVPTS